ncbi:hypothetical protein TcasGA2_TC033873 [Tribolium castaneum]|uniref:Uncharacterized protein n=1 Tax=Tribolium castaneum TaxID=7070 RepID=A0A139WF48_TRICA|nr:hypothetical protein TcasGA2_TC033873 [Tribolium castaneum]
MVSIVQCSSVARSTNFSVDLPILNCVYRSTDYTHNSIEKL